MNAPSQAALLARRRVELPTGTLELSLARGAEELDDLLGFAARANAKRGFLFLSKVLGKHWPAKPSDMLAIHARLAATVPAVAGPVVFIAMAETAIGLGQGVFEAWLRRHPGHPALFLHTTRYRVGAGELIEFEEAHSHAPRQFLHVPEDPALRALLLEARTLVLVDDEASTGNTFVNLAAACRHLNPGIERVHLATITNFMGGEAGARLDARFGLPVTLGALVEGEYRFTPGPHAPDGGVAQRFDAGADRGASAAFGRLGLQAALPAPEQLAGQLASGVAPGERVLVLGTGEFMHASTLLGAALERRGVAAWVQSTTRSPILAWGAVAHALRFADNYGEGIANFLYNVAPGQYEHVFVCHETAPNSVLRELASQLGARLLHHHTGDRIEEVPVR
ncbi:phosphoribosyltransferase domain-containing protein [Massilia sp. ST3]|uniref:phosphoribosyltransferase domain-containing protein n=1 Tax=Massilia sp. ST3 TaxID=2824903 RepID=UPI001B824104|nr:phosphoribosyltransferase domain-containing protein [Massilia sp. ST3]MBQ5946895.1 phosphoribosyltransferase domain-containing protein [Massilia sp. ST3]